MLQFARPLGGFIPLYALYTLLGVFFGLMNFTLFIPLLDVLFQSGTVEQVPLPAESSFTIGYVKALFYHYFGLFYLEQGRWGSLKFVCTILMTSVFLANLFRFLSQKMLTTLRARVIGRMRDSLITRLLQLDLPYFHARRKGDLMSVLSNDVQAIEDSVVIAYQTFLRDPLMIVGTFTALFLISPQLTLYTLIVLPVSVLAIAELSRRLKKDARNSQNFLGRLLSISEEVLSNIRVIKAFGAETRMAEKFNVENRGYIRKLKNMVNKRELASPLTEFLYLSVIASILLYGGKLIFDGNSTLSGATFMGFILLYTQLLNPAKSISGAIAHFQRGMAAGERVFEIIDAPNTIFESPKAISVTAFRDKIEFHRISFSYREGETGYVLKDIDLTIPRGQMVALVGHSGSGKTTLSDLLPRYYDPSEGYITLDGTDLKEIKIADLRHLMGIVSQEAILFNDTVGANIAFAKPGATRQEVEQAARIANAHEFIAAMEHGYDTPIGDRGVLLSGGQRQRLSIARAVLKNPPILILDEATSSLDAESERLVQAALEHLMRDRTTLVIAHRLATVKHADRIVVLDKGRIVQEGTHAELIATPGLYKQLTELQHLS